MATQFKLIKKSTLTRLADVVRKKSGITSKMSTEQVITEIDNLKIAEDPTVSEKGLLSFTENELHENEGIIKLNN
jgi:hypothetical protein